ncbi:MAG: hypothetical protein ACHQ7M_13335 [Chloroflexota bacterium]
MQSSSGSASVSVPWDDYADRLRAKLPPAPESLLNGYVRFAPWIAIVFGAFGVVALLGLFLVGAALTPIFMLGGAAAVSAGGAAMFGALVGAAGSALDLVGGVLMLRRRLAGWWLLALGLAVSIVTNLLHVTILGLAISLLVDYIHLQVKPLYK